MQGLGSVLGVVSFILVVGAVLLCVLYRPRFHNRYDKLLTALASTVRLIKERLGGYLKVVARLLQVNQAADLVNFESEPTVHRLREPTFGTSRTVQEAGAESIKVVGPATQPARQSAPPSTMSATPPASCLSAADPVIVLHVVAYRGASFYGDPLLRSLKQLGLRYGERAIFHRHLNPAGSGPVLFSLLNMVKPGAFNLAEMREFKTPGVALCMKIPAYGDTLQNFKLMLQAAQRLANDLNGVVLDDERHLLTLQKSEHYKTHIRDFLATIK